LRGPFPTSAVACLPARGGAGPHTWKRAQPKLRPPVNLVRAISRRGRTPWPAGCRSSTRWPRSGWC